MVMLEANPDTMAERILAFPKEQQREQPAYETVIDGPSVNLIDYYEGQVATLKFFDKINKGENFRNRFSDGSPFVEQYDKAHGKGAADKKYDESAEARIRLDRAAKNKFAGALGYSAIATAKLRPKIVIDSILQSDYDNFSRPYYGITNKDAQNSRIKELEGRLKELRERIASPESQKTPERPADTDEPTLLSMQLDETGGILTGASEDINPEQEMTFIKFMGERGSVLGKAELEEGVDVELHVRPEDFTNIRPSVLRDGLYIHRFDPRYSRVRKDNPNRTQQLAWAWGEQPFSSTKPRILKDLNLTENGVVLPADEFSMVAHSPSAMTAFAGAKTRDHNAGNTDIKGVDEKVGRSRGHTMEGKIDKISELIPNIEEELRLFKTIYDATNPESPVTFKAKELEVLFQVAQERLHILIDTARLNLSMSPDQVKAMHRALASKLTKANSEAELAKNWRVYASLGGQYAYARLTKAIQSRERCREELEYYQPYLDRGKAQKAA